MSMCLTLHILLTIVIPKGLLVCEYKNLNYIFKDYVCQKLCLVLNALLFLKVSQL